MTTATLNPCVAVHVALLDELRRYLTPKNQAELETCSTRLEELLLRRGPLAQSTVLAMFGGGKDSSYMTAAVRYMQIVIKERRGETFNLRIATNCHAGMPSAVICNIHNVYKALELYHDPTVELLAVYGNSISNFSPTDTYPDGLRRRDRHDVLMNGHRCGGDPRPTFCNRCNIGMENALALAIGYEPDADVVITGDSSTEQRHYQAWVRHAGRKLKSQPAEGTPGLKTFLFDLEQINRSLSGDVFGDASEDSASRRLSLAAVRHEPSFFSIYQDTGYRVGDHWELLVDMLGFVFDHIAFSFTESDCGNPGLMAHLSGLRHERLLNSTYATGIKEYADFAIDLMRRKDFPENLISVVLERYSTSQGIAHMRDLMDLYAQGTFDLTEEQLVCMLFSPFTNHAERLHVYLEAERKDLLPEESAIRALLSQDACTVSPSHLSAPLTGLSGLGVDHLQRLFQSHLIQTRELDNSAKDPISVIYRGDPHKKVIERRDVNGDLTREYISGR